MLPSLVVKESTISSLQTAVEQVVKERHILREIGYRTDNM
jgi:hypothetical protein